MNLPVRRRAPNVMYSTALVFEEIFPQTGFAIVSCAVPGLSKFYSPVVSISQTRVHNIPGAHLLGSTARIQRDIRSECFCSCKQCCCRAECVLLLGFNVQSDILAVMIAWSWR